MTECRFRMHGLLNKRHEASRYSLSQKWRNEGIPLYSTPQGEKESGVNPYFQVTLTQTQLS